MVISSYKRDEDLMRCICKGNHQAFTELVAIHTERFFALAYRTLHQQSDAEDVVQSVFIKLWQNPHAWKADKSRFTTWFYRVVLNACHDHQRKFKRIVFADIPALESIMLPCDGEQDLFEQKQELTNKQIRLEAAIADLPTSQQDALNLIIYSELPQKQAADVMGISLKAIESLLVRAKKSLKASMNTVQSTEALPRSAALD